MTVEGRRQAGELAALLQAKRAVSLNVVEPPPRFARIYTSPLRRAVETAQILSVSLKIPYEITDALREFDCGIAEGGADEQSWAYWHWVWEEWHIYRRYASKIEGGESYLDLVARMRSFLDNVRAPGLVETGDLILVGHGGLFSAILPDLFINPGLRAQVGDIGIPNTALILAESTPEGLVCREWCGKVF